MAFSVEAAIIVPVIISVITGSVMIGADAALKTAEQCNDSDKTNEVIDPVILIEAADLTIDIYGNLTGINTYIEKISGALQ